MTDPEFQNLQAQTCPKCGCPARYALLTAVVRVPLDDGNPRGKVTRILHDVCSDAAKLSCGGGHVWTIADGARIA